jgi:hypothetical protein
MASSTQEGVLSDEMYEEVLLHLPADQPELLFRCTAVSQGWRRLITEPSFLRRFREFHRDARPMLGYIFHFDDARGILRAGFAPTTPASITLRVRRVPGGGRNLTALDSRHGRVLFEKWMSPIPQDNKPSMVVWDAVSTEQQEVRLPEAFFYGDTWSASILCDAQGCDHLHCGGGPYSIIFIRTSFTATYAYAYASATDVWTATALLHTPANNRPRYAISKDATTVVGGCIYFRTVGTSIIRYQLFDGPAAERLSFIQLPPFGLYTVEGTVLVPAAGDRLRFAAFPGDECDYVRLWEKVVGPDGALQWILQEQFELPLPGVRLMGFVEKPPSLILYTEDHGPVCINMETREWNKLPNKGSVDLLPIMSFYHPILPGTEWNAQVHNSIGKHRY